jgi:TPP-dependent pyruvate/acetoin dehydrogenase alpha subunit
MSPQELIDFEKEVARRFEAKEIRGPIHLNSETQISSLMTIFAQIKRTDWVLATYRGHYHALLHGVPRERVMDDICAGRSMSLHYPEHRFMTSAIVGGLLPIACGLAGAGEKVWCFVGDMAYLTGGFHDAQLYASANRLPVKFIVENNGLATNTPTRAAWGSAPSDRENEIHYEYRRTEAHCGSGVYVQF